jgi:hypothetical protein
MKTLRNAKRGTSESDNDDKSHFARTEGLSAKGVLPAPTNRIAVSEHFHSNATNSAESWTQQHEFNGGMS